MKKKSNFALALIVLVVIVAGAAYFSGFFRPGEIVGSLTAKDTYMDNFKQAQLNFEAEHGSNMIAFTHPTLGYTVKYPIGYLIASNNTLDLNVSVRILAKSPFSSDEQHFAGEVITVHVFDQKFDDKDFQNALAELNASDEDIKVTKNYSGLLNGKKVYLYTVEQQVATGLFDAELFIVKNAVYPNCKKKNGETYSALLTVAVPQMLADDLDMADYVIGSFKC